jgi:N-acetylmuramoyl-L-alanine amidase
MNMNVTPMPSPHFDNRAMGSEIQFLILHYTGVQSSRKVMDIFTGKDNETNPSGRVSAHYMIDEDGSVYQFVEDTKRAWHAGLSYWKGITDMNSHSIGIELHNPGHDYVYHLFAEPQITSLIKLCKILIRRYHIPAEHVLGHSDIAPGRKKDPGELFPWDKLAKNGIGQWPGPRITCKQDLIDFGYNPECEEDVVMQAYYRHYHPQKLRV